MRKILFFEDYPQASENRLLRLNLRHELHTLDIWLDEEKTVNGFEDRIRKDNFDAIILDIMADAPEDFIGSVSKTKVKDDLTGIELLHRCRTGIYGKRYTIVPIYMRTARGEHDIRQRCELEGATGYFRAGIDDADMIERLRQDLQSPRL